MSGPEKMRLEMLVENAHPRRIARHAAEWERCAGILDDAADRIETIIARQAAIGGQTGPAMARAMAEAAEALQLKARELWRGSQALTYVSEAAGVARERRHAIDRDHPDDGHHLVIREERSRSAADDQEAAFEDAIAVMKTIQVGPNPARTPVTTTGPGTIHVPPPSFWPPAKAPDPIVDPVYDPTDDPTGTGTDPVVQPQGPGAVIGGTGGTGGVGGAGGATTPVPVGSSGGASGPSLGTLAGAATLGTAGTAGAVAGARSIGGYAGGAGAIGAGRPGGASGVLGRGGSVVGAGGSGGPGARRGSGASRTTAGARTTGRAATGAVGGAGGRGSRRKDDEREGGDRDLFDDGDGWLDDEAGPEILR